MVVIWVVVMAVVVDVAEVMAVALTVVVAVVLFIKSGRLSSIYSLQESLFFVWLISGGIQV